MSRADSTCWEVIDGAAAGDSAAREEFACRYAKLAREYLWARWKGSPLVTSVEDATGELFVECLRQNGVLERVRAGQVTDFRAFFYGVVRNVACRWEERARGERAGQAPSSAALDRIDADETTLSRVLDRAWAREILDQTWARLRRTALGEGEAALRRIEILRTRFEDGVPIRELAARWGADADELHGAYRRARREFRACLREELELHGWQLDGSGDAWQRFASLLG